MADGGALINFGEISKPATVLIEKISDAVGGIAKPWQIKRVARAEAEADIIRAEAKIEISEREQRALVRMIREEGQKQENIESITAKAIPQLKQDAKPQDVEKDWIANFFDKSRLISDEEMQSLWANILAGEANSPGSFSKKTVNLISSLDKKDAHRFTKFCTYCWMVGGLIPIIFDNQAPIYTKDGINLDTLLHLDTLGLIDYENLGLSKLGAPKYLTVFYYGKPVTIEFPGDDNKLPFGQALLTQAGQQLAPICGSEPSDEFFQYVLEKWRGDGLILSSPIIGRVRT